MLIQIRELRVGEAKNKDIAVRRHVAGQGTQLQQREMIVQNGFRTKRIRRREGGRGAAAERKERVKYLSSFVLVV
ncbi:hypothetical protein BOTCAL_0077g00080 [Botryotinia calthae]|uniref:Uncharacterized protein n=1 Tax=Botryotinia calthae TaxID=38488 RepID=A0A4Y8DAM8_9HELO|nr:hypothetical protein BOTCAL_0077g00080 [Botryotinia calthae]